MIIFFSAYYGGTHGTAKSARDFLRALLACQKKVKVISPAREVFPDSLCGQSLGTPVWFDLPPEKEVPFKRGNLSEWLKVKTQRRRLRHFGPDDVLVVNGWASYEHWQKMPPVFTCPKVMVVRESPRHFDSPDIARSPSALLEAFSSFDHLVFVSQRGCDEWRQFPEIAAKPCSVLPNCCEEEEVSRYAAVDRGAVREQCGFRKGDFVVLCPGTIEHRKGQDLVLDILPVLQEKIRNLKLLLIGNPHSEWGKRLLENIPAAFRNQSVFHRPAQPSIADLLFASDLLIFPSRAEAMPRTILEAMALKTSVVASDVDGTPELVVDGQTGLLFPCGDAVGLLQAIERMHADPEFRAATAVAGSERYWAQFSRRCQFERMPGILEEIRVSVSAHR